MTLNLSSPAQVAGDSASTLYIADTGNNRLVQMTLADRGNVAASITGLTSISGVAVDDDGNVYVNWIDGSTGRVRKYNSSLVQQWDQALGFQVTPRHMATDGTELYVSTTGSVLNGTIYVRLCSAGTSGSPANIGTNGSGDGQFSSPWGIATDGTSLYVVDQGNSRVQKFTTSGNYVSQFSIPAGCRGCALDTDGRLLVADFANDLVRRYTGAGVFINSFSQVGADGIAITED